MMLLHFECVTGTWLNLTEQEEIVDLKRNFRWNPLVFICLFGIISHTRRNEQVSSLAYTCQNML